MSQNQPLQTRRDAIFVALAAAGGAAAVAAGAHAAASSGGSGAASSTGHEHDWDWLVGRWSVHHRRLKARLAGSTEWEEFNGRSELWSTLGGLGNLDDNVIELPGGTYRAMTMRAFDPEAGLWSIWWLDGRNPTQMDPPVRGVFKDGVGTFGGDDTLRGRPIKVRFQWSDITPTSARWAQAFSPDAGATWETNWVMDFTRIAAPA